MPGKKLLVADDSLTIQKVIRLALSNEGYEIQAVSDGNDAIQQISLTRPDVVLIDVSLPGKTAFEVKEEINAHEDLAETRFILMSSAFEKVDEPLAAEVEFHGRLIKPFDPAHLRQVLTDVLAQVAAKRMEKTSILQRPSPPPQQSQLPIQDFNNPFELTLSPPPGLPDAPPSDGLTQETFSSPSLAPPLIPPMAPFQTTPGAPPPPSHFPSENTNPSFPTFPSTFSPDHFLSEDFLKHEEQEEMPANWEKSTINPEELPPFSSSERAAIQELWEPDQDPAFMDPPLPPSILPPIPAETTETDFSPPPPPPLIPVSPPQPIEMEGSVDNTEQDIKELTESTMRITGLPEIDDYQWSVKEPTLKPPSKMLDSTGSPRFQLSRQEIPPSEQISIESDFSDPFAPPPPLQPQMPFSVNAISQEQIDAMVKEQVEATLVKMVQKMLPEIAERLIKQEIHRMLSES